MATEHIVVDGSNIATEGRSTPSLAQLESAVSELRRELSDAEFTVVVDATFAHRIDRSELDRFEAAVLQGDYVSPPAGAVGRGDAFLLRIAEKVNGTVLSNDSFQEFHGEHAWLFERGRLLGATPVPGVGWIFVPRTPVRGPRSRVAVRETGRAKERVEKAIKQATKEAVAVPAPADDAPGQPRTRRPAGAQSVNDPVTFIAFIADHPLGTEIEGTIDSFTSHGAVVRYGDVRCYVPLSGLGEPPPRSAREVLRKGESRGFVVTALDPQRRGIELALPGVAVVSGHPTEETVAAAMKMARTPAHRTPAPPSEAGAPTPRRSRRRSAPVASEAPVEVPPAPPARPRLRKRIVEKLGVTGTPKAPVETAAQEQRPRTRRSESLAAASSRRTDERNTP